MRLEELDVDVPQELIAQEPAETRDSCRLMVMRTDGRLGHRRFGELPGLLRPGDLLVLNDSRVIPARLNARKPTGGDVELLFVRPAIVPRTRGVAGAVAAGQPRNGEPAGQEGAAASDVWEVLARPSHRLRPGGLLLVGGEELELGESLGDGKWLVSGPPGLSMLALMNEHGRMPLPPYIKIYPDDPASYQTVYAREPGSAAAPTAGLHFTPELLDALAAKGIRSAFVTLHVGLDTFLPIREARVEDHHIHTEAYSVSGSAMTAIAEARETGRRVVAVGTTATRVLETLASEKLLGSAGGVSGFSGIFITPGYDFQAVDALLTNLHLPRSSVLALTMSFAGVDAIRRAYAEAVARRYRFFSFGDAMLIERPNAVRVGA